MKIIRETKINTGKIERFSAAIIVDSDGYTCLEFEIKNQNRTEVVYADQFNIDWLKDERQVDWLASVIGRMLMNAYDEGILHNKHATAEKLKGLKYLLGL